MTPEDKIVAAIDRNTEAVEQQTTWLQIEEADPQLDVLEEIKAWVRGIFLILFLLTIVVISIAKASPITHVPIVEQPLQYWHTQWVPTDGGVYLQEVYAPALPRVEPELYVFVDIGDPPRLAETPEPGTVILVAGVVFLLIAGSYTAHLLDRAENRELDLKLALIDIKHSNDIERSREIARKALKE